MKKLFALLLVLVLLVCTFSGCTSKEEGIPTEEKLISDGCSLYAQTDIQEMYQETGTIIRGTIVDSRSYDKPTDIGDGLFLENVRTEFTVQVNQVYKGEKVGRKVKFWEVGGEGTKIIVNNPACEAYFVGYEGFFFIYPDGWAAPYLEIEDGSVTFPSYITPPKEIASKDSATVVTVEQFGEILAGYAK